MHLNDVWLESKKNSNFYTKENFKEIPYDCGIYAWYYPIRLTKDKKPSELIYEIKEISDYDSKHQTPLFQKGIKTNFNWCNALFDVKLEDKLNENTLRKMDEKFNILKEEKKDFSDLARALMKATILTKPLYIGKAKNLNSRIYQHLSGQSGFSTRFASYVKSINEDYATKSNNQTRIYVRSIRDLMVATISINDLNIIDDKEEEVKDSDEKNYILEETLKYLVKPMYSVL